MKVAKQAVVRVIEPTDDPGTTTGQTDDTSATDQDH
jgi:hypothetical protein